MKFTAPIAYILIFWLNLNTSYSQEYFSFKSFTHEKGLKNETIRNIVKDENGFIWIASFGGLCKFDGYEFKYFEFKYDSINYGKANFILEIFYDKNNAKLWLGSHHGLHCFNLRNEKFERLTHASHSSLKPTQSKIRSICVDRNNNIWFCNLDGLICLKNTNGVLQIRNQQSISKIHSDVLSNADIRKVFTDPYENIIWLSTEKGMYRLRTENDSVFVDKKMIELGYNFHNYSISEIKHDTVRKLIYFSTDQSFVGIFSLLNTSANGFQDISLVDFFNYRKHYKKTHIKIGGNTVFKIDVDVDGNLWGASREGLLLIKNPISKNRTFHEFQPSSALEHSLIGNRISNIYSGNSNIVWISHFNNGINLVDVKQKIINRINPEEFFKKTKILSSRVDGTIEDSPDEIYFNAQSIGLFHYNIKTAAYKILPIKSNCRDCSPYFYNSLDMSKNGTIYIGTLNGCLIYSKKLDSIQNIPLSPEDEELISRINTTDIKVDPLGNVWISGWDKGLAKLTPEKNDAYTLNMYNTQTTHSLSSNTATSIYIDTTELALLLSTSNGLNYLYLNNDYSIDTIVHYQKVPGTAKTFDSHFLYEADKYNDSVYWFGSQGGGMAKVTFTNNECSHIKNISVENYNTNNANLHSDIIQSLVIDDDGVIWGAQTGITMFNPNTNETINFHTSDGLTGRYSYNASYKDRSGRIYFCGNKGIAHFLPKDLRPSNLKPKPTITQLFINDKDYNGEVSLKKMPLNRKSISLTDSIYLSHDENDIEISFSALIHTSSSKIKYKYMLSGADQEFTFADADKRSVRYRNLRPGNYTFLLNSSNHDNIWFDDTLRSLYINITPPLYQTIIFKISLLILVSSLLLLLNTLRLNSIKKQKVLLEIKIKERTLEIKDKNVRLRLQAEELESQKEELLATNEELITNNLLLEQNKKELQNALKSLKLTQSQLVQSEKLASVGFLTAGVAHELNNPLNYISSSSQAIETLINKKGPNEKETFLPLFSAIKVGIERATQIISSLNRFSRKSDNNTETCDVHSIIDNCLIMLHNQIKYVATVEKSYTKKKFKITGNEGKLHQVFLNVLINASHAIANKGLIKITTEIDDNNLIITISDNGSGISKENLPRITEPFFTTKEPGKGTGLGLSISSSIIHEHNGYLNISSEEGKGASVKIGLPLNIN